MSVLTNVKEFMVAAGQDVPNTLTKLDSKTKILRVRLILEEALEFAEASGVAIYTVGPNGLENLLMDDLTFDDVQEEDFVEIADACADLNYVVAGGALSYGIDLEPVDEEVHRSNLAKFGPGSWKDENGKIRKPPGWTPPDIKGVLTKQCLQKL